LAVSVEREAALRGRFFVVRSIAAAGGEFSIVCIDDKQVGLLLVRACGNGGSEQAKNAIGNLLY
jgi:hypothetical protein